MPPPLLLLSTTAWAACVSAKSCAAAVPKTVAAAVAAARGGGAAARSEGWSWECCCCCSSSAPPHSCSPACRVQPTGRVRASTEYWHALWRAWQQLGAWQVFERSIFACVDQKRSIRTLEDFLRWPYQLQLHHITNRCIVFVQINPLRLTNKDSFRHTPTSHQLSRPALKTQCSRSTSYVAPHHGQCLQRANRAQRSLLRRTIPPLCTTVPPKTQRLRQQRSVCPRPAPGAGQVGSASMSAPQPAVRGQQQTQVGPLGTIKLPALVTLACDLLSPTHSALLTRYPPTPTPFNQLHPNPPPHRMLYDGGCPLCMKEVQFLMKRDAGKGRIDFVDIAAPTFSPADNNGITYEQVGCGVGVVGLLLACRG